MIGELTLDGRVRCVPGVLPMTMAAAARGIETVYVPEPQAAEAAMVPGMRVFGIRSLGQVMALLTGEDDPRGAPRSSRCRARRCSPGAGRSGSRTSTWPTSSGWPTRATPSRSRRPAATT